MTTDPLYIAQLVSKKFREGLTEQEAHVLNTWILKDSRNAVLLTSLEQEVKEGVDVRVLNKFDEEKSWVFIQKKKLRRKINFWSRIAAILAAVFTISFFVFRASKDSTPSRIVDSTNSKFKNDVLPAIKGAKIIRGDGTEFKVEDNVQLLADGSIATENNEVLTQGNISTSNKLVVPAANYLNLTLSDGTKVWVNASSELEFPTTFLGGERKVSLKGEAYFEVAKDLTKPFTVETSGGKIQALGTHFNVSAYDDKPITTLEEGKVIVSKEGLEQVLQPGMKAQINGDKIDLRTADLQRDLAWKNNAFYFKGDNIISIAKQLEKWYDLEVSFAKGISFSQTYTGEISRESKLSEVLNMLEFVSDLEFKIDKNRLLILNNKV